MIIDTLYRNVHRPNISTSPFTLLALNRELKLWISKSTASA